MIEQAKSITIMIKIADDAGIPLVEPKRVYSVYPKYRSWIWIWIWIWIGFGFVGFDRQVENFGKNKIVTDYYDKILEGANLKQTITLNV